MVNLLPQQEKTQRRRRYYGRLSVVGLLGLFGVLLAANIALVPSVVLSSVNLSITQQQKQELENSEAGKKRARLSEAARQANQRIDRAHVPTETQRFTGILRQILEKQGSVALSTIVYQNKNSQQSSGEEGQAEQKTRKFQIRGIARDRETLVALRDRLEADPLFERVVLPVSSLVAERDIEFTVEVFVRPNSEAATSSAESG